MYEAICIPYYISFHIDKIRELTYTTNNTHPILRIRDCIPIYTYNHMRPIPRIRAHIPTYTRNHTRPIPRIRTCIPMQMQMQK